MEPFSEWQMKAWASMTLEYLHPSKAPELAISDDRHDLLLPFGLKPLPDIPDPMFVPRAIGEIAPRVKQKLEDRACGQIKARNGRMWLVFQPISELCVCIGGARMAASAASSAKRIPRTARTPRCWWIPIRSIATGICRRTLSAEVFRPAGKEEFERNRDRLGWRRIDPA
jgi:hypothetical protein